LSLSQVRPEQIAAAERSYHCHASFSGFAMRKALLAAVTALTSVVVMSSGNLAFAQSDRTLGISCTVAGHEHCGETGRLGGRHYRHYRHYR
jgi:hypothetical protein